MQQEDERTELKNVLNNLNLSGYHYDLPPDRIAKFPLERRDDSKLLVYNKGTIGQSTFADIDNHIDQDDLVVFNNSKVIQARLEFSKQTGAKIEIFCLEPADPSGIEIAFQQRENVSWHCLIGNLKKWKEENLLMPVNIKGNLINLVAARKQATDSGVTIQFTWDNPGFTFLEILEAAGKTPIPPYLKRESQALDVTRYQTVYSINEGSVAAPTAGLHFTRDLLDRLENMGADSIELTLHVGLGTFRPIQSDSLHDHEMHTEHFSISKDAVGQLRKKHSRIISVGTTSVRTLESLYILGSKIGLDQDLDPEDLIVDQWDGFTTNTNISREDAMELLSTYMTKNELNILHARTRLMIVPGFKFRMTDGLITNFHMPRSSLILLVSAFIGEDWKSVYQYALDNDFRFLSYGDSSFLYPLSKNR